jgi:GAF domain-containing protein
MDNVARPSQENELAAIEDLNRVAERVAFLSEAGKILSSSIDLKRTFGHLGKILVPEVADVAAITLIKEGGRLERILLRHVDLAMETKILEIQARHGHADDPKIGMSVAMSTGKSQFIPILDLEKVKPGTLEYHVAKELGIISSMAVPLRSPEGQQIGAIWLGASQVSGRHFTERDLELVEDIALLAASAVHNATLHSAAVSELERARVLEMIREEYVQRVVHDIKSPLTAASMLLQLLERRAGDLDDVTVSVRKALDNMNRAVAMVDNLSSSSGTG